MIQKIFSPQAAIKRAAIRPVLYFIVCLILAACGGSGGRNVGDTDISLPPDPIAQDETEDLLRETRKTIDSESTLDDFVISGTENIISPEPEDSGTHEVQNKTQNIAPDESGTSSPDAIEDTASLEPEDSGTNKTQNMAPAELETRNPDAIQDAAFPEPEDSGQHEVQNIATALPANAPASDEPPIIPPGHTVRIASRSALKGFALPADQVRRQFKKDAEYNANFYGFERVNVRAAYDKGATGYGVIIGVVDDFLETGHDEFIDMPHDVENDRLVEVMTSGGERWFISVGHESNPLRSQEELDQVGHGTKVAGLLAARRDERAHSGNMHGIAYDSAIIFRSYHLEGAVPGSVSASLLDVLEREGHGSPESLADVPDELNHLFKLRDIALASGFMDVVNAGAKIVNSSAGFGNVLFYHDAGAPGVSSEQVAESLPNIVQALRAAKDRAIIVFAAGNEKFRREALSPVLPYALQFYFEDLRTHVATIVSVNPRTGKISTFSNRCGVAAEWCLAAPGQSLSAPRLKEGSASSYTTLFSGTSAAAPMVAGGLALLIDYFGLENYTLADILNRLYDTADKNDYSAQGGGDYSDSAVYGQGLMDLGAAIQPFGPAHSLIGGTLASAQRFELAQSRINLGSAFGDSLMRALSGQRAVFFDSLDFSFEMDAADYISASPAEGLASRLARLGAEQDQDIQARRIGNFYFFAGSDDIGWMGRPEYAPEHAFFNLAENAFYGGVKLIFGRHHHISSLLLASARDDEEQGEFMAASYGLGLAYHFEPRAGSFSLEAGWIQEKSGLLLSAFDGPFALSDGGATLFFGMSGEASLLGSWMGAAQTRIGWTAARNPAHGGLSDMTDILSSAWAISLYRKDVFAQNDMFSWMLSQPLRAEKGAVNIHYTTARTSDYALISETMRSSLEPSARTFDLEARYKIAMKGGFLILAAGYALHPGHSKNAKGEARILARFSFNMR